MSQGNTSDILGLITTEGHKQIGKYAICQYHWARPASTAGAIKNLESALIYVHEDVDVHIFHDGYSDVPVHTHIGPSIVQKDWIIVREYLTSLQEKYKNLYTNWHFHFLESNIGPNNIWDVTYYKIIDDYIGVIQIPEDEFQSHHALQLTLDLGHKYEDDPDIYSAQSFGSEAYTHEKRNILGTKTNFLRCPLRWKCKNSAYYPSEHVFDEVKGRAGFDSWHLVHMRYREMFQIYPVATRVQHIGETGIHYDHTLKGLPAPEEFSRTISSEIENYNGLKDFSLEEPHKEYVSWLKPFYFPWATEPLEMSPLVMDGYNRIEEFKAIWRGEG